MLAAFELLNGGVGKRSRHHGRALRSTQKKVRVCPWWPAGNLGGGALGAGVLLLLAEHIGRPMLAG